MPALRTLPAGRSVRLRFRATLAANLRAGEVVRNQAQVSVRDQAPVPSDDPETDAPLDPTSFVVGGGAGYTLIKRVAPGDGGFAPGSEITYTLVAENIGSSDGEGVALVDRLPPELIYVPGSTTLNGARVPDVGRQSPLELGLALRTPGGEPAVLPPDRPVEVQVRATIAEGAARGQVIANQGTLSDLTGVRVPSDDPTTPVAADPTTFVVDGAADLGSFVKSWRVVGRANAAEARIGETVEWALQVTNRGIAPGDAVRVSDPLPAGVRYVDGSLQLDGRGLSDAPDGDRGQVVNGQVTVDVGVVGPGTVSEVRFRTVVLRGPEVRNQGTLTAQGVRARLSDDDGVEANGLNPTVVPVGDEPLRRLTLAKRVIDADGAPTLAGESLTWVLTVGNAGNTEATDVEVSDPLPTGLVYVGPGDVPRGVRVDYEPPPAGDFQNGRVRITGLTIPAGEDVTVSFVARVDPRLDADRRICNGAQALAPDTPPVDAPVACVDAEVRFSRLRGTTFEDRDEDGVFNVGPDLAFVGMRVAAYEATDPDGPAVLEATTDDAGRFLLDRLRPGRYRLRVFSSADVLLKTFDDVELAPDVDLQRDLLIDPSGRVYDSVEGDLIDGAEVFIYRDVDLDDFDPLDDESQAGKVLVPPEDLEAASQQGQRTAHGGLYRFAVRRPGRYLVEVVPPSPALIAPSVLVPATPGLAFTDDPEGRVVAADVPSTDPSSDRTYFLAFDLQGLEDQFRNNHIPLDPLSALIDVEKRSLRRQVTLGEVVTWEVDVINRSPEDLIYDTAIRSGGVYVQDVLPKGLKYVAGSTVLVRVEGGREVPLSADDPVGARLLRFGRVAQEGGRTVLRALDLHAGEHLKLRYQTVVGADARPREEYTNRATLLTDGNVPISRTARATVRVLADPDFDQGLVLGRVWCDADGDGRQQPGEPGLPGVQLYMDHGYSAVTDSQGQFHFKDIDPGTHAVKVDPDSLLPGAEFTTDALRTFSFTRGLPVKVGFGVTCPTEPVAGAQLVLAEGGMASALAGLRAKATVVYGDVNALRAGAEGEHREAPGVTLELLADGKPADGRDLRLRAGGTGDRLVFKPQVPADFPVARWTVRLGPFGETGVAILTGAGRPPAELPWDQRSLDGLGVLTPEQVYSYRLEVADAQGMMAASAPGRFGLGVGRPALGELVLRLPADAVRKGRLRGEAKAALQEVLPKLKASALPIVVEAHTDNQAGPLTARRTTRDQAGVVMDALEASGLPSGRLSAEGVGGSRPLVPNIVPRNQARNRRIEIWLRDPQAREGGEVPQFAPAPVVRVGRDEASPDAGGQFAVTADVPPDGIVEVFMEAPDGRRAVIPLRLREGSPAERGVPRALEVAGEVPGALTLGGAVVTVPPLDTAVRAPETVTLGTDGLPTAPVVFQLSTQGEIARWRLALHAPGDRVVPVAEGTGSPPGQVRWTVPKGQRVYGGEYQARLTVRRADHAVVQSPPARFIVGAVTGGAAAAAAGSWTLAVDGVALNPAPDGRVGGRVEVRGQEAVLFELTSPAGARAMFFVPPPAPAAPGEPATVTPPKADAATTALPPLAGGDGPGEAGPNRYAKLGDGEPGDGSPDPAAARRPLPDAERARLAAFGRAELVKVLAPAVGGEADVPAQNLTVRLPAADAELTGATVPVVGQTAPGNRIVVNGAPVAVDSEGRFSGVAQVNPDDGRVRIEAVDPQGNRAALERKYAVRPYRWFLLALGESTVGTQGSELDGVEAHTHVTLGDTVYLHGRAAAFFKGYMKGSEVLGGAFQRLEAVAHLDTARRREFETYFRQVVDPEAFYPVYGDSAKETKEVNTRGPLYVALRADANELTVGNFRTRLRGIELFNYDRTLYGAAAAVDQPTGDFKHEVRAFVSDVDQPERHAYVELRGTGGSLYYLPHRELLEGSERLYLVERDRISNIERRKTLLTRNVDYVIQYRDGRVLMKAPVPSVTLDGFGALPQPSSGSVLDGHPVFVAVEYDHQDIGRFGDTAVGVHARETYKDAVSIGAGYVEEGRGSAGQPDYELWGVDLRAKHRRKTRFEAEFARSQSQNAENLFSLDGGLTFEPFNLRDGSRARGSSFLLRSGLELDDLVGQGDTDQWYTEAYWQYLAPGFYSGGNLQQQGLESYGVLSQYHLDENHLLRIQHDGTVADDQAGQGSVVFRAFRRDVTRAGHVFKAGKLQIDSEFVHTVIENGQASPAPIDPQAGPLNQQVQGGDLTTDVLNVGLRYELDPRWTLLAEQEVVLRGDARIHEQTTDLLATTVGARFKASEQLTLELTESARWSGDNATQLGVRTQLDDRHTLYGQQRLINRDGGVNSTTVLGGEERFGADGGGRAFAEYQLESGVLGERNRAVLGVGQRKTLIPGLTLDAGYQRSQVVAGGAGEFSQDALTLGVEWLDSDKVKVSGRYEIRYEDNDEAMGRRDRLQWLALNSAAFKLHRDLTLLLRGNWSHTVDLAFSATEAELIEGSVGLAWRPVEHDWLAVILKYTKRYEQRPTDVTLQLPEREEADVVSVMPIVELPYGFQLVEKLAWKRNAIAAGAVPAVVGNTVLWINRLNYHLTNTWDVGAEYRWLRSTLAQNQLHGTLLEVNYIIQKTVRLGLGYNFTRFSDDEFSRLDEDHGGAFFRVIGQY
ncbi:MAG: DUF11 domain-containing protein [Myxococcales bacterium]|nr:DUF11 domain-containing protein [Myxococcales bacterium]